MSEIDYAARDNSRPQSRVAPLPSASGYEDLVLARRARRLWEKMRRVGLTVKASWFPITPQGVQ